MKKSKYENIVYDGLWRFGGYVENTKNGKVIMENIYNGKQITITRPTLNRVIAGKTEISKVIAYKEFNYRRGKK